VGRVAPSPARPSTTAGLDPRFRDPCPRDRIASGLIPTDTACAALRARAHAQLAEHARERTLSIVFSLRNRRVAISRFVRPSATRTATSRSRGSAHQRRGRRQLARRPGPSAGPGGAARAGPRAGARLPSSPQRALTESAGQRLPHPPRRRRVLRLLGLAPRRSRRGRAQRRSRPLGRRGPAGW